LDVQTSLKSIKRKRTPDVYGTFVPWCTRSDVSPLRYPGGKRKLAPFVADLITRAGLDVDLLVEPFAGGAAVAISLLESGHVRSIALADADPLIASFWKVVFSRSAGCLADMVSSTGVSLTEWRRQKDLEPRSDLAAAFKCLFLNRTSFSGALMSRTGPIGGIAQDGPYRIGCRFNQPKIAKRIMELSRLAPHVRFVRNESYRRTIAAVARTRLADEAPERIFWYLDPPFFKKADRLYRFSFTAAQHETLSEDIDTLPGHWLLSYDDHPNARRLYSDHRGFARVNLHYNARIDASERLVASEVIVSDTIADLRQGHELPKWGQLIRLPRRRQPSVVTGDVAAGNIGKVAR
jgi:DNA adenine methylase